MNHVTPDFPTVTSVFMMTPNKNTIATFDFALNSPELVQNGAPNLLFYDFGGVVVTLADSTQLSYNQLYLTYGSNVDKVPIPGSLLLLGTGLVGLEGIGRKNEAEDRDVQLFSETKKRCDQ